MKLENHLEPCDPPVLDQDDRVNVNFHHPQTATAGDTSGKGTVMYFISL